MKFFHQVEEVIDMFGSKKLRVKKLHPDAILPKKNYRTDACFDLYSIENNHIYPSEVITINTGIAIELPEGYAGFIWDRSGLGRQGIHRLAGVIDSSYRGPIKIVLAHINRDTYKSYCINKGDRIAQLHINKVEDFEVIEVDELSPTKRGEKGWGSSGR